jgi:catechol 1,2-dioxygenase
MQRRKFLQNSALCAVAVSTSGFVHFNGSSYAGDCETTTDILGPFYRPDAPNRSNLLIKGAPGQEVVLTGIVRHKDCKTAYKGARVELWHCGADGQYDNTSPAFRYRATGLCDEKGRYKFLTHLPVPYDVGDGSIRPAHFHLMISAPGYQSLVTQLYFTGDPHLATDEYAASPAAKQRILAVKSSANGQKLVTFDVSMTDQLAAEVGAINQLTGTYTVGADQTKFDFFNRDGQLWVKSGDIIYGVQLAYQGNNTFSKNGLPSGLSQTFTFEIQAAGPVKLTRTTVNGKGEKLSKVAYKG